MPIRQELRHLYPKNWVELSRYVRFQRAQGRCQSCRRPHLVRVKCLPNGTWFDETSGVWRDARGRKRRLDLFDLGRGTRHTRVVLAAAHVDGDVSNNRKRNLRSWCQRCHLQHDRDQHRLQRWITYRRRYAWADLLLGPYEELLSETTGLSVASIVFTPRKVRIRNEWIGTTPARQASQGQPTAAPLFVGAFAHEPIRPGVARG